MEDIKKHNGDITITEKTPKEWLNKLKHVEGVITVPDSVTAVFQALQSAGSVVVGRNAAVVFPSLQYVLEFVDIHEGASAQFPALQSVPSYLNLHKRAKTVFPALQSAGSVDVENGTTVVFPALQAAAGYVYAHEGSNAEFPMLQSSPCVYVDEGAAVVFHQNLKKAWGINSGDTHANVVFADNVYTLFKDIKKINCEDKNLTVYTPKCAGVMWTVTDGKYWTQGKKLKYAVADLNFKYLNEKRDEFKNLDQEKKYNTEELIYYYRIITGACLAGSEQFVKNNCNKNEYTLKELIEFLQYKGAYVNEKFAHFFEKGD